MESLSEQSPRPMSVFEKLPIELLHHIFLDSANFDLPGTTLHLTRTLSSKHLQLEVALRTLYDPFDWMPRHELHYMQQNRNVLLHIQGGELRMQSFPNFQSLELDEAFKFTDRQGQEIRELLFRRVRRVDCGEYQHQDVQSRLVDSRFFTWDFFLSLVEHAHPLYCKVMAGLLNTFKLDAHHVTKAKDLPVSARPWYSHSAEEVLVAFQAFTIRSANHEDHRRSPLKINGCPLTLPWLHFGLDFKVPPKLLRGPWPREQEALLFWMYEHGARTWLEIGNIERPEMGLKWSTQMLADAVEDDKAWIVEKCVVDAEVPITAAALRQGLNREPFPFTVVSHLLWASGKRLTPDELFPLRIEVEKFLECREIREAEVASSLGSTSNLMASISTAKWTRAQVARWWPQPKDHEDDEDKEEESEWDGYDSYSSRPYFVGLTDISNLLADYDLEPVDEVRIGDTLLKLEVKYGVEYAEDIRLEQIGDESRIHEILVIDVRLRDVQVLADSEAG